MKIVKASEMGFCFGVKRALELLLGAVHTYGEIEILGAAVHNRRAVGALSALGVKTVENLEQVQGKVVSVPSHGLGQEVIDELRGRGLRVIDTTCPRVRKAQTVASELARAGFEVVIFGDASHPEVKGVLGWAGGRGIATLDSEMMLKLDRVPHHLGILSQTTQSPANFAHFVNQLVDSFLPRVVELRVANTICAATSRRQRAAVEVTKGVDLMIVIGERDSANTRRLAEVCASTGVDTRHIETADEVEEDWLKVERIGITAGASTPNRVIEEVVLKLEGKKGDEWSKANLASI